MPNAEKFRIVTDYFAPGGYLNNLVRHQNISEPLDKDLDQIFYYVADDEEDVMENKGFTKSSAYPEVLLDEFLYMNHNNYNNIGGYDTGLKSSYEDWLKRDVFYGLWEEEDIFEIFEDLEEIEEIRLHHIYDFITPHASPYRFFRSFYDFHKKTFLKAFNRDELLASHLNQNITDDMVTSMFVTPLERFQRYNELPTNETLKGLRELPEYDFDVRPVLDILKSDQELPSFGAIFRYLLYTVPDFVEQPEAQYDRTGLYSNYKDLKVYSSGDVSSLNDDYIISGGYTRFWRKELYTMHNYNDAYLEKMSNLSELRFSDPTLVVKRGNDWLKRS